MKLTLSLLTLGALTIGGLMAAEKPNIVVIYADDMGYGDVQALNPDRGKILTPHMDKFISEGMVFTDAHTTSSVCTPSRYSLLTGRYNWRTKLQDLVLWGYSPPLISDDTLTIGKVLQQSGYKTAMIGKWHLGMHMPKVKGKNLIEGKNARRPKKTNIDWEGEIKEGPTERGFDYLFGTSASLDMAPYVYIENNKFTVAGDNNAPSKPAPDFKAIEVLDEYADRSAKYISEQKDEEKPFFLYVPLTSPHTPILPTEEWKGKSGLNDYADFQMQTDAAIGKIIDAVDAAGLKDDTLIIISSDNGCSKAGNIKELESKGHFPSAQFRGSKSDLWEGGLRVPFLVRWPAKVKAGSVSGATICQSDLLATFAEIVNFTVPETEGEDSVSFLPALIGNEIISSRKGIISHSISGHFAYRMGDWKLLLAKGSGGWTLPRERDMEKKNTPKGQLYNLADDPGERNNLFSEKPEMVAKLLAQLKEDVNNGRSTAGPAQPNDIPNNQIKLWKGNVSK